LQIQALQPVTEFLRVQEKATSHRLFSTGTLRSRLRPSLDFVLGKICCRCAGVIVYVVT